MSQRPSSVRKWAENADPEDIAEPVAERPRGYLKNETFPHDQANWLFREIFHWIRYFDNKFNNGDERLDIVEDIGAFIGTDDEADFTGSVDLTNQNWDQVEFVTGSGADVGPLVWAADVIRAFSGIIAGDAGRQISNSFNSASFDIDLRSGFLSANLETVASANVVANAFGAVSRIYTDILQPETTSGERIDVRDGSGNQAEGGFDLDILSQHVSNGIAVADSSGTRGLGGFYQKFIQAAIGPDSESILDIYDEGSGPTASPPTYAKTRQRGLVVPDSNEIFIDDQNNNAGQGGTRQDYIRPGTSDRLRIDDSAGVNGEGGVILDDVEAGSSQTVNVRNANNDSKQGELQSLNTPRAYARVGFDSNSNPDQLIFGLNISGFNVDSNPTYEFEFSQQPPDEVRMIALATINNVNTSIPNPTFAHASPEILDANNDGANTKGVRVALIDTEGNANSLVKETPFSLVVYWQPAV